MNVQVNVYVLSLLLWIDTRKTPNTDYVRSYETITNINFVCRCVVLKLFKNSRCNTKNTNVLKEEDTADLLSMYFKEMKD